MGYEVSYGAVITSAVGGSILQIFFLRLIGKKLITPMQFLFFVAPIWFPLFVAAFPNFVVYLARQVGIFSIFSTIIMFYGFYNLLLGLVILIDLNKLRNDFVISNRKVSLEITKISQFKKGLNQNIFKDL